MLFAGKISETGEQLGKLNEADSERQILHVSSHLYKYICIYICVSIGHKYRRETMWAKERRERRVSEDERGGINNAWLLLNTDSRLNNAYCI